MQFFFLEPFFTFFSLLSVVLRTFYYTIWNSGTRANCIDQWIYRRFELFFFFFSIGVWFQHWTVWKTFPAYTKDYLMVLYSPRIVRRIKQWENSHRFSGMA